MFILSESYMYNPNPGLHGTHIPLTTKTQNSSVP